MFDMENFKTATQNLIQSSAVDVNPQYKKGYLDAIKDIEDTIKQIECKVPIPKFSPEETVYWLDLEDDFKDITDLVIRKGTVDISMTIVSESEANIEYILSYDPEIVTDRTIRHIEEFKVFRTPEEAEIKRIQRIQEIIANKPK